MSPLSGKKTNNKATSPSKFKMPASPIKNFTKSANLIDTYATLVTNLFISVASKPKDSGEATFIHPYKKIFNESDDSGDGEDYAEKFGICGFFSRKNPKALDGKTTIKQNSTSKYDWDCMVSVGGDDATPEKIGKKIAREFSKFSKHKELSGMKDPERFAFRKAYTNPLPLNNFLLDDACILFLRRMDENATLDEIKQEETLMESFFGSVSNGRKVLDNLDEDDWEDYLAY